MANAAQKISLNRSRDIPFDKLILSQANVRRTKAGVSIEELAVDIAHRGLLQSLHVRPVLDAEGAGVLEIAHVPRVEQVEHAVGEHHRPAGCPRPADEVHRLRGCEDGPGRRTRHQPSILPNVTPSENRQSCRGR